MRRTKTKPRIVSRDELAKLLEVSTGTVARWTRDGTIDAVPQRMPPARGRRVMYDYEAVCVLLGVEP